MTDPTRTKITTCKGAPCAMTDEFAPLEASGYCFRCAEEVACLLADEGVDPSSAWNATDDDPEPDGAVVTAPWADADAADLAERQERWDRNRRTGGTLGVTGPRPTR